jgi:hypothetical protein
VETTPTPESELLEEEAGTSLPAPTSTPAPIGPAEPVAEFKKPETRAAVKDYLSAVDALKRMPTPVIVPSRGSDPYINQNAITGYLNQLGQVMQRIKTQREAAEATLDPSEKKRFRALQRSVETNSPDDQ